MTLRPSGEWTPQYRGWIVARVAEGAGYWLNGGNARELNVGDGFAVNFNSNMRLRASQLGPLKLQFFTVQPQYLNGVLTVAEWHQLETAPDRLSPYVSVFTAAEPVAQKFARIAGLLGGDGLALRCALLQVWASALHGLLTTPAPEPAGGNKLHERFRQLLDKMTGAELAEASLAGLAGQLHCSERHFSRLFREEFGVPLRTRQTELRLQRAQQLLADSNAKVINVAYDSGYRHLGLFNAMFKKRFGVTPSEWREQKRMASDRVASPVLRSPSQTTAGITALLLMLGLFFSTAGFAQTSPANGDSDAMARARAALYQKMTEQAAEEQKAAAREQEARRQLETEKQNAMARSNTVALFGKVHRLPVPTNAGPSFKVDKYLVSGNSILAPGIIGGILTNVPDAFGTNVTFEGIQAALGDLQMAYRERGYVTVSVGLPPQKLTNAVVKVKVTEAPLAAINVTGNRWFSTENVRRALPSLHTNMLLNSHVFQRELDVANASRNRQIYPVIGPGPEPGTSALTLKVKDTFPMHGRVELNNQSTPGTPQLRVNSSLQYDNLWDLDHQVGLQYSFTPEQWKGNDYFNKTPLDDPLIANYSGYYRMPLAAASSVEREVEGNPTSFGYNEVTHKFNLPPATGRPELNFYASRSTSETGVKTGPASLIVNNPPGLVIISQDSGDNLTLNGGLGGRLSLPLREIAGISSTLSFGIDYKHYQSVSYNTNNFYAISVYQDTSGNFITNTAATHSGQPTRYSTLNYLPLNIGLNSSIPDPLGTTFFNATVNFNPFVIDSGNGDFAQNSYSTNARANYVTVLSGVSRDQALGKGWTLRMHADGQWASTPLISNEQFAMGGTAGVRGYMEGELYGDTGWRLTLEPRTPQVNIGMVDGDIPFWVRASAFVDYGEVYRLDPTPGTSSSRQQLVGVGSGITANIGSHLDARLTVAWPLLTDTASPSGASDGSIIVYFGIGAQF
ncbi:MAG: helix-turn-helix domain-containing protein [Verrucomicrobiales bacterium]|nr:helix-turn-helix domain-containing protein [Verrucomicrobiales bacterium]